MSLIEIQPESHDVLLEIAYATSSNLTGRPIYARAFCYLHQDAVTKLARAADLAKALGLRLKIFDAYRPPEAQWRLWEFLADPTFIADPRRGSAHSRGVAVDLTLVDAAGHELDMGTGFDAVTPRSYHASGDISEAAQRNRFMLLGLMTAAGWDFYAYEWWHYQLFDAALYPMISDAELPAQMMR